ncbi:SIMPL domain-containing protein [Filimonas effusa]|nr:SIMPL domain-containing protein [Filimonas effusa]
MRNALSLLVVTTGLFMACSTPSKEKQIEVTGEATMKVVPDMVEFSLSAANVKPAMKDAVAETQAAVNEILAVCKKYVQSESDIKVSAISTNKSYDYRGGRDLFNGYEASQVLDVTLKDITRMERFTEELLATKISRINNIRYNHTKSDSIMREVNLLALEDARKTAGKMCDKMDVSVGKVLYLSNYNRSNAFDRGVSYAGSDYNLQLYNKGFGGAGFKMTAEILEFRGSAYASFAIN